MFLSSTSKIRSALVRVRVGVRVRVRVRVRARARARVRVRVQDPTRHRGGMRGGCPFSPYASTQGTSSLTRCL